MVNVSIIIPCYNHATTISRSINSCFLIQSCKEIIVINDGSTDDTESILHTFAPNIKIIHQDNQGVGSARNIGIYSSKYDYILLLDADDEFLIGVNKLLENINEYDIIYGNVVFATGHINKLLSEKMLSNKLLQTYNPLTSVLLFNKKVWSSIGGFSIERNLYEDWDFIAKAFYQNFQFKYIDTDTFIYNRSNNGRFAKQFKQNELCTALTLQSINQFKDNIFK